MGCGSTSVEPIPTEAPETEATEARQTEATETAHPPASDESAEVNQGEGQARAAAEAFVRAQGYADSPPTVSGDAIVHEGIEGTLADRLNSLDPHPLSVGRIHNGWGAVFRYADPQLAGRGRQLLMPEGEAPHFVHQDMLLNPEP